MKKPHYYYKTWAESCVGVKLSDFQHRCADAEETARQWAEDHGIGEYIESPDGMAGGIAFALTPLDPQKPFSDELWEKISLPTGEDYYTPIPGNDLEKEMYALPVVSETELIGIMAFVPRITKDGKKMPITFGTETPVLFKYRGWWYIDVPYECEADSLTRTDEREFYRKKMSYINTQD